MIRVVVYFSESRYSPALNHWQGSAYEVVDIGVNYVVLKCPSFDRTGTLIRSALELGATRITVIP